jgi:multiple sugar transport system permease protein
MVPAESRQVRNVLRRVSFYVLLAVLAVPLVFPMWWMVSSSLKMPAEVFAYPPVLWPSNLRFENYVEVFARAPFGRQYFNSVYIAIANTLGTILISAAAGYAFARIAFPGRTVMFVLLLSSMLMPAEVTIIPLFVLMGELGWLNTHVSLLVEPMFGPQAVVGTFIMRQYFLSLPIELEDAGRIDGLGRWGLFRHIALPLAGPALATVAILTFLSSWNAFLEPLVFLGGQVDLLTIPLALQQYIEFDGSPVWEVQLAATTLSVLPVVIVFLLAQRHFIQGIARVGIHG